MFYRKKPTQRAYSFFFQHIFQFPFKIFFLYQYYYIRPNLSQFLHIVSQFLQIIHFLAIRINDAKHRRHLLVQNAVLLPYFFLHQIEHLYTPRNDQIRLLYLLYKSFFDIPFHDI